MNHSPEQEAKLQEIRKRTKAELPMVSEEYAEAISLLVFCAKEDHEQLQDDDPEIEDDDPESWGPTNERIAAEYLDRGTDR